VEADCHCALGQERWGFVADDTIRVVDAEDEEGDSVGGALAVCAGAAGGGKFICAENVLGAEVARTEAVAAAVELGDFRECDRGQALGRLNSLGEGGANVAAQRIVAGQSFVRMMTFFLPLSAATMAASGKGRITLMWMEPTLAPRVWRR
jgi:hypothetical protein